MARFSLTRGILAACLLLLLGLRAESATVVGSIQDSFGDAYAGQVRTIQFDPLSAPQAIGTNTVWPVSVSRRITNGLFTVNLVGGLYWAGLQGDDPVTGGPKKTVKVLVPPNDTNTYTFNQVANLATNLGTFAYTNRYYSYIGDGAGITNLQGSNIVGLSSSTTNTFRVLNVKELGAAGDGSTDDTAAIQNAINLSTNATLPSSVYFPPGRYKLTSSLRIWPNDFAQNLGARTGPTRLLGDGSSSSVIESYVTNGAAIDARIETIDGPGLVGFTMERLGLRGPIGRGAWTNDASEGLAIGRSNAVHWTGTNWITEGYGSQYYGHQIRIADCDFSGFTKAIGSTNVWGFVVDGGTFHSNRLNALAFNCTHSASLRNVSVYGIAVSNRLTDIAIGFFAPREAPSWWGFGDTAKLEQTQVQWARVAVYNDELQLSDSGGNYQFVDLGHQIRSGSRTNGSNVEIWRPYADIIGATYCDSFFPWVTNSPAMVEIDSYVAPRVTFHQLIGDVCKNVRPKVNIIGATTTGSGNNGTITFGTANLAYPDLVGGAGPWPALFNGSNVISLTKLTNSASGIQNGASGVSLDTPTFYPSMQIESDALGSQGVTLLTEDTGTGSRLRISDSYTTGAEYLRADDTGLSSAVPFVGNASGLTNFTFDTLQTFNDITNTGSLYNSGVILGFGGLNIRGGNVIATNGTTTLGNVTASGTFTGNGGGLTNVTSLGSRNIGGYRQIQTEADNTYYTGSNDDMFVLRAINNDRGDSEEQFAFFRDNYGDDPLVHLKSYGIGSMLWLESDTNLLARATNGRPYWSGDFITFIASDRTNRLGGVRGDGMFYGNGSGLTNLALNGYGITNAAISGTSYSGTGTNLPGRMHTGGHAETNFITGSWSLLSNANFTLGGSNTLGITLTGATGGQTNTGVAQVGGLVISSGSFTANLGTNASVWIGTNALYVGTPLLAITNSAGSVKYGIGRIPTGNPDVSVPWLDVTSLTINGGGFVSPLTGGYILGGSARTNMVAAIFTATNSVFVTNSITAGGTISASNFVTTASGASNYVGGDVTVGGDLLLPAASSDVVVGGNLYAGTGYNFMWNATGSPTLVSSGGGLLTINATNKVVVNSDLEIGKSLVLSNYTSSVFPNLPAGTSNVFIWNSNKVLYGVSQTKTNILVDLR